MCNKSCIIDQLFMIHNNNNNNNSNIHRDRGSVYYLVFYKSSDKRDEILIKSIRV